MRTLCRTQVDVLAVGRGAPGDVILIHCRDFGKQQIDNGGHGGPVPGHRRIEAASNFMAPQLSPTGMLDVSTTPRPGFTVRGDDFRGGFLGKV